MDELEKPLTLAIICRKCTESDMSRVQWLAAMEAHSIGEATCKCTIYSTAANQQLQSKNASINLHATVPLNINLYLCQFDEQIQLNYRQTFNNFIDKQ